MQTTNSGKQGEHVTHLSLVRVVGFVQPNINCYEVTRGILVTIVVEIDVCEGVKINGIRAGGECSVVVVWIKKLDS